MFPSPPGSPGTCWRKPGQLLQDAGCRDPIPQWHQVTHSEDHPVCSPWLDLNASLRSINFLVNLICTKPNLWKPPRLFQMAPPGDLHSRLWAAGRSDHCSRFQSDELFSFPQKVEEHQGRKKPSEVPLYINSPVGSMTKVLLCCWTMEWIIYSYPPRLAIKQLTTLKIAKKGPFTETACLKMV